jgi:hypothetical protein
VRVLEFNTPVLPKEKKKKKEPGGWWLMLVILATQEAEIRRIMV